MKLSPIIKTIVIVSLIAALVIGANIWRNNSVVRDVKVEIDYQGGDTLITPEAVKSLIDEAMPTLYTTLLSQVDTRAVEEIAARSPYLTHLHANVSLGNAVVLYATQRRPVVRVMVGASEYYISQSGHLMPVSRYGSSNVIVAGGYLPPFDSDCRDTVTNAALHDIWVLARHLDSSPCGDLFDQIYRDDRGDLYLTPKIFSHIVQVGSAENLDHKFHNLQVFYTQGLPQAGWDTYSEVSIKYRNQIVATHKSPTTH